MKHDTVVERPFTGMIMAFKANASSALAGIPGRVTHVWPRFRSGDYLVTLEYAEPVRVDNTFVTQIDAFVSELEPGDIGNHPSRHSRARSDTVEARSLFNLDRVYPAGPAQDFPPHGTATTVGQEARPR